MNENTNLRLKIEGLKSQLHVSHNLTQPNINFSHDLEYDSTLPFVHSFGLNFEESCPNSWNQFEPQIYNSWNNCNHGYNNPFKLNQPFACEHQFTPSSGYIESTNVQTSSNATDWSSFYQPSFVSHDTRNPDFCQKMEGKMEEIVRTLNANSSSYIPDCVDPDEGGFNSIENTLANLTNFVQSMADSNFQTQNMLSENINSNNQSISRLETQVGQLTTIMLENDSTSIPNHEMSIPRINPMQESRVNIDFESINEDDNFCESAPECELFEFNHSTHTSCDISSLPQEFENLDYTLELIPFEFNTL